MSDEHWNEVDSLFEAERRKIAKAQERDVHMLVESMRAVLQLRSGRDIVWWLLERCGVHAEQFAGRALEHAYFAGQRSIGCEVLNLALKADPAAYAAFLNDRLQPKEKTNG